MESSDIKRSSAIGVVLLKHAFFKKQYLDRTVHVKKCACGLWVPPGGQDVVPNVIYHKCVGLSQNFSPPLYVWVSCFLRSTLNPAWEKDELLFHPSIFHPLTRQPSPFFSPEPPPPVWTTIVFSPLLSHYLSRLGQHIRSDGFTAHLRTSACFCGNAQRGLWRCLILHGVMRTGGGINVHVQEWSDAPFKPRHYTGWVCVRMCRAGRTRLAVSVVSMPTRASPCWWRSLHPSFHRPPLSPRVQLRLHSSFTHWVSRLTEESTKILSDDSRIASAV